MIETVDYHAGGEPFRIVLSGVPDLPGDTVRARRSAVPEEADAVRRLLCHEPRGHADMYGCFLIRAGREVKAALAPAVDHPDGIYGTILYEELPGTPDGPHQRNVTVFADGEVDRSPCGSGTSARLALLDPDGVLTHESILGTRFRGRVVARSEAGVVTEVEGTAYRTGEHRFILDPRDPLGTGFVLR